MDEGPFRTPSRPEEQNASTTPSATAHAVSQPKQHHTEPKRVHRSSLNYSPKQDKPTKRIAIIVGVVVAVAVIAAVVWWAVGNIGKSTTAIDGSKYQAVFFTNGQVYFGKLHTFNNDYFKLTDVFYLQNQSADATDSKNPQKSSGDQNSTTLIKLGDEIHGPEDEMVISKDQVLFFENLKKDGKVSQSIDKYKNPN